MNIVIATIKPWNIVQYKSWKPPKGVTKYLVSLKEELSFDKLKKINPHFIFFPHWSWIIPAEIYENFECIVFHMTDVPFGRGGSPLQNLIIRKIYKTKISALKVIKELDAGPVYLKRPFDLSEGSAEKLYQKIAKIVFQMISEILEKKPRPQIQCGKVTIFKRRRPEDSEIPLNLSPQELYDFIRMLDAETYPKAFIKYGNYKIEFSNIK